MRGPFGGGQVLGQLRRLCRPSTDVPQALVRGDPEQPRRKLGVPPEPADRPPRRKEDVLSGVLSAVAVPQHPGTQPDYRELIAPHQDLERPDVSSRRPLDQQQVAGGAHPQSGTVPDLPIAVPGLCLRASGGHLDTTARTALGTPSC